MLEPLKADTGSKRYYLDIAGGDKKGKASLDEHHSHFILVNDSQVPYKFGKVHSPSQARGL